MKRQLLALFLALAILAAFFAGSLSASPSVLHLGLAPNAPTEKEIAAVEAANALLLAGVKRITFMPMIQG